MITNPAENKTGTGVTDDRWRMVRSEADRESNEGMANRNSLVLTVRRIEVAEGERTESGFQRLLPDEENILFLHCDGNGQRFLQLFREVWAALPPEPRQKILEFWAHWPIQGRVELICGWSGHTPGVMANTGAGPGPIRFHADYMDAASDVEVRFTIAHELAHMLQMAGGRDMLDLSRDRKATEAEADSHALHWLGLVRRPRTTRALRARIIANLVAEARARKLTQ